MSGLINMLTVAGDRFTTNLRGSLVDMSAQKWIRLVIIIGAYMLLRPYMMRLGARMQLKSHEHTEEDEAETTATAKISPNTLRGQVEVPDDTDDEEGSGDEEGGRKHGSSAAASGVADWGKKARRRQRQMIRKLVDAQEKRLQESREEEEDKDIEEFLVKE